MKLLNRAGFSLLPRQPFVDWVQQLPVEQDASADQQMSLKDHCCEGTVYMVDEVRHESDFSQFIAQHWSAMFENELAGWDEFGDYWPDERDQAMFEAWFELKPQVMVFDLSQQPLMTAALAG